MDTGYRGTNGDDVLNVPNYPDNNTYLAGLAGNDVLYDHMSYSFNRFNALYGGSGNDTYVTAYNSCAFIGDIGGVDTLALPYSYDSFLWRFYDDGDVSIIDRNHLYLEIDDYEIFIQNFDDPQYKVEYLKFSDRTLTFDEVFSAIRYELDYDSFYEFSPSERQKLQEAMALRDTLAAEESGASGGGGGVPPSGGGGLPPLPEHYDDMQYLTAKTLQMVAYEGNSWSAGRVQDAFRGAGLSGKQHFERFGAFEKNNLGEYGIDPSANFDVSKYYLWKQSIMQRDGNDISMENLVGVFKNANLDPLSHYINFGYSEGIRGQEVKSDKIDGMTEWNEAKYYAANPGISDAVKLGIIGCGFEHYLLFGQFEGRPLE